MTLVQRTIHQLLTAEPTFWNSTVDLQAVARRQQLTLWCAWVCERDNRYYRFSEISLAQRTCLNRHISVPYAHYIR